MEMINVEERERIRRAYYVEQKSIREIAREMTHGRETVRQALESASGEYRQRQPRAAPVLGPYKGRIDDLLAESERLPRKQRYTGHKIFTLLQSEGYTGSEPSVRRYIGHQRQAHKRPPVYLPLEFDPGVDAQVDWGEGVAEMSGEEVTVQLFYMRLNYSRRLFMMAFPVQKQEAFFEGHVQAFHYFGGVPHRISYDNLKTAVKRLLTGRHREEQQAFTLFRSHYLFDSHFCTPGAGHEKGGVESGVGFGRRNFMVPIPQVASFDDLNAYLLAQCLADDARQVAGQAMTIGEAWQSEKGVLRPLPEYDYACCITRPVTLTPYSQIIFETNRYSVPVDQAVRQLTLRAFPFVVEVLRQGQVIAHHARCYGKDQDVFDPLHYLPLLEQRPGAFEHAKPLRRWRETWPPIYEDVLAHLRAQWPEGRGVREFIRILRLHTQHPADLVERALIQALAYGCPHYDGVVLCLNDLLQPSLSQLPLPLNLLPLVRLAGVGEQSVNVSAYDQLLPGG
jgi:transposase